MRMRLLLLSVLVGMASSSKVSGSSAAVYDLIDRIFASATARDSFDLVLASSCDGLEAPCFVVKDGEQGKIAITASGGVELAAGIGEYLRGRCNMTFDWPRGGGSSLFVPATWPVVGTAIAKRRSTPLSYYMNVCTHSYSLVWYDWAAWQSHIDWMALNGINLVLAVTGQEEVQYKVFSQFGLNDTVIRSWFNGPAYLAWSRGQNEYGAGVAGPLPRSWMQAQWSLQRQILARYRELGIIPILPAFQGNVPAPLAAAFPKDNITVDGATGWITSTADAFGKIADAWMSQLIADFGTDHYYQCDGYFDGSTAPWLDGKRRQHNSVTVRNGDGVIPDPDWLARGTAAYQGMNRTDPEAIWLFQGWAIVGWSDEKYEPKLKGFVDAVPAGKFVIIDMSVTGEWRMWQNSAFFGAPFIWTTLHDFGGNDGMKGDLGVLNALPFDALTANVNVIGTGYTPEGIDQNPLYYQFVMQSNFRSQPIANLSAWIVDYAQRRYGVAPEESANVGINLLGSAYDHYESLHDRTGISISPLKAPVMPVFDHAALFQAWTSLLKVAAAASPLNEPLRYDLINVGREVLAGISVDYATAFQAAVSAGSDAALVNHTGSVYAELLMDVDTLLATDQAFLLGPWIQAARFWGQNASDTTAEFYAWNSKTQITTWYPMTTADTKLPGLSEYANKHWSGLIAHYYAQRVIIMRDQSLAAIASGKTISYDAVELAFCKLAMDFQRGDSPIVYPVEPVGDALAVSQAMMQKYGGKVSKLHS